MKHKTADLADDLLDTAVALADGRLLTGDEPRWPKGDYRRLREEYGGKHVVRWYGESGELGGWEPLDNQGSPSTDWLVGGPIIERERITVAPFDGKWAAMLIGNPGRGSAYIDAYIEEWDAVGPTPLIAAMRAFVAAKLGDEVELP